ncbi:Cytochrome P450 4C1 [Blattella germanica]|nr:Cytochrome P450 4C1 [Blattella germanica]
MDVLTVSLTLLILVLLLLLARQLNPKRSRFVKMVNQMPGPPSYPIVGSCWELLTLPLHRYLQVHERRNKQYSSLYRSWIGEHAEVILNDPDYVEVILNNTETLKKSPFYKYLHPWLGEGLLTLSGINCPGGEDQFICDLVVERCIRPWLHNDFIFKQTQLGKRFTRCTKILHEFTDKVIRERNILPRGELDKTEQSQNDYQFSEEMCDGIMFGEKAFEEIDRIFEGSDRAPKWRDLQEMKYLERVIKETLRLYPPAPAMGRELEKDIQIGKYTVPAGVSVWIQIYFLHRNPKYFPNPEEFNPDNFLPEKVRDRHPYAYIPWSAGPRNCLGQKYALLEAKALLSNVIRNFKIISLRKTKDVTPVMGITLSQLNGVYIKVSLRDKKK